MEPGPLGAPFAPLYRVVTSARRAAYTHGWLRSVHAGLPTFSVGALEVGGTGKTPVARWLLRGLLDRGHHPGVLTRGYGRLATGLEVHVPNGIPDPDRIGDEPALVAASVPVPIAACGDRLAGARALRDRVDALVLDDGFSHRRLGRDLDLVVLRSERLPSQLRHLPWGPLRESIHGLGRAHVAWIHGVSGHEATSDWVESRFPALVRVLSRPRMTGTEGLGGERVVLVTGIARPERVVAGLEAARVIVEETILFPDHHRFDDSDVRGIARRTRGRPLVCTAKDAVKLARFSLAPAVVDVEVEVFAGEAELWRQKVEPVFEQHARAGRDNSP